MRRLVCVFVIRMQNIGQVFSKGGPMKSQAKGIFLSYNPIRYALTFFNFQCKILKTVWILISWLLMKPADQNPHSFCPQDWTGFPMM